MKVIDTKMRLGRVRISDKLMRESINNGIAARIFYGSVPLDVERNWITQISTFLLWHPKFSEVKEGGMVPNYSALVTNGVVSWEQDGFDESSLVISRDLMESISKAGVS